MGIFPKYKWYTKFTYHWWFNFFIQFIGMRIHFREKWVKSGSFSRKYEYHAIEGWYWPCIEYIRSTKRPNWSVRIDELKPLNIYKKNGL